MRQKNKLFLLLALLLTAATGAWAQESATTYSVKMKGDTPDAKNWTIASGGKSATGDAADGLTGLSEGQTVTLTYTGRLKVKGVKATSDAAPAEAPTITLDNTTTAWTAGSYAVPAGGLTYSDAITVSGDVTLTLTDGETLTLNKGISLASGATLTIQGNGAMVVNGTNENTTSTVAGSTGTLTLTSGTLTATGGNGGSGVYDSYGGNGGDAINGSVIVSGGTLTATGGNGGSSPYGDYNCHGGNGGDAINGSVTVSSGTLTARGGNGGSVDDFATLSSGGKGGDAISGTLTINGGSTSVNDGSNGSIGNMCDNCTAGTGGKAATEEQAAKAAATVTTAPTGAAIVGVGKTTALVSGGVAEGGTLRYAVTTENTQPTSTDGFSDAVPTAQSITASGKVYVWYYVKGDDTHTDSEIAATAIEVTVADIVWDATNVSELYVSGTYASYTQEGVKLSGNSEMVQVMWFNYGDGHDGISINLMESGGLTFTAPTGKKFTKIEMNALGNGGWDNANLGTGWAFNLFNIDETNTIFTVTWKGSAAASTVDLLKDVYNFSGETVNRIAFYLSE